MENGSTQGAEGREPEPRRPTVEADVHLKGRVAFSQTMLYVEGDI